MASSSNLCDHCKQFDLRHAFKYGESKIPLSWNVGAIIQSASSCSLCGLLLWILDRTPGLDNRAVSLGSAVLVKGDYNKIADRQFAIVFSIDPGPWLSSRKSSYAILPLASGWPQPGEDFPVRARRVRGTEFDAEIVRGWLSTCSQSHGFGCNYHPDGKRTGFDLRVIDVNEGRVILAPDPCKYTALSYVWGDVQQPVLERRNHQAFEQPRHLFKRSTGVPLTILHAIKVCQSLGLQYLWVDSLCISHDSETEVEQQVRHMDVIYRRAYLTIIAPDGDDCSVGLPSIRPRNQVQKVATVKGLEIGTVFLDLKEELLSSKWNTRAWTLQEYALSHRCLIFSRSQIFFSCEDGIWREDVVGHLVRKPLLRKSSKEKARFLPIALQHSLGNRFWSDLIYIDYVELSSLFATRQLTYPTDILKAFGGIIGALPLEFIFGLPKSLFRFCLCWSYFWKASWRPSFPSWSWAGWNYALDSSLGAQPLKYMEQELGQAMLPISPIYMWHESESELAPKSSKYIARQLEIVEGARPLGSWSARDCWKDERSTEMRLVNWMRQLGLDDSDPDEAPKSLVESIISFRTCSARLDLRWYPPLTLNLQTHKEAARRYEEATAPRGFDHRAASKPHAASRSKEEVGVMTEFILLAVIPPNVVVLPIEKDPDFPRISRRLDNPRFIHEGEWFASRPIPRVVHLA